jgi:hypothetical protein
MDPANPSSSISIRPLTTEDETNPRPRVWSTYGAERTQPRANASKGTGRETRSATCGLLLAAVTRCDQLCMVRQFQVHSCTTVLPATIGGIRTFLGPGMIKAGSSRRGWLTPAPMRAADLRMRKAALLDHAISRADLPALDTGLLRPVRVDDIRSASHSGSHVQSVLRPALSRGGRGSVAQLIRASPSATATFITRHGRTSNPCRRVTYVRDGQGRWARAGESALSRLSPPPQHALRSRRSLWRQGDLVQLLGGRIR